MGSTEPLSGLAITMLSWSSSLALKATPNRHNSTRLQANTLFCNIMLLPICLGPLNTHCTFTRAIIASRRQEPHRRHPTTTIAFPADPIIPSLFPPHLMHPHLCWYLHSAPATRHVQQIQSHASLVEKRPNKKTSFSPHRVHNQGLLHPAWLHTHSQIIPYRPNTVHCTPQLINQPEHIFLL
ncbi:hypothetical protein DSO57_1018711 [Entomophthora muscae]|uniref:Uncharacterized protein n=1 Tax=Entomophthora muscae TaxID=34485 RepID=A0ACC2UQL0_9FUNG|nr:hypothetical protein DSO57_1018711 [Entomophthora muscae]